MHHDNPALLLVFFAGTVVVVLAVVAMVRIDDDWADAGAVGILVTVAALLLGTVARRLRDEEGDER